MHIGDIAKSISICRCDALNGELVLQICCQKKLLMILLWVRGEMVFNDKNNIKENEIA